WRHRHLGILGGHCLLRHGDCQCPRRSQQPDQFFTPGIGVLLAFTMAAFMGFESGAIYSEEAKNPERTVSRATYIAVGIIAAFYAFSAWALQMGVGPESIVS